MTWSEIASKLQGGGDWLPKLLTSIEWILWIALILVGACGSVYAIYVGVKMARADSSEQREEAKKRLIGLVVGIVILVVLILFFTTLFPEIIKAFVVPTAPSAE